MKRDRKVPTVLRLSEQMRDWLRVEAGENGRTINGEAAFRLKRMMEQENAQKQQA